LPAAAQTPFIRQGIAAFSQDSAKVTAFRRGVRAMKSRSTTNPTSWWYQANMHGVVSGTTLRPQWATCNHGTWFFHPWHRMYLYWFERILRHASGSPTFALPYWNYKDSTQRRLPLIFRSPNDASVNPLYEPNRRSSINAGTSGLASADVDDSAAFAQNPFALTYVPYGFGGYPDTAPRHFGDRDGELEWSPHNSVHSTIGGYMGDLNRAARDAIFWVHHANIDRLWNRWLSLGRRNPRRTDYRGSYWLDQRFTFFNEQGVAVTETVEQFLATRGSEYRYDTETTTAASPMVAQSSGPIGSEPMPSDVTVAQSTQPVRLGARPVAIPTAAAAGLRTQAEGPRRLFVTVAGLTAKSPPGSSFDLFLNLPAGTKPNPEQEQFFVGRLSFFGRSAQERPQEMHGGAHGVPHGEAQSVRAFDITDLAQRQQAAGHWRQAPRITIVPVFPEDVDPGAEPTVARVAIIRR
jgi:tyrosinase